MCELCKKRVREEVAKLVEEGRLSEEPESIKEWTRRLLDFLDCPNRNAFIQPDKKLDDDFQMFSVKVPDGLIRIKVIGRKTIISINPAPDTYIFVDGRETSFPPEINFQKKEKR